MAVPTDVRIGSKLMTRWDEKPTNITFHSAPEIGTKAVKADNRASAALLRGLEAIGFEAHRVPVGDGMYEITITKLPEEDADATVQL